MYSGKGKRENVKERDREREREREREKEERGETPKVSHTQKERQGMIMTKRDTD